MYRIMLIPSNSPNPVALFFETRDAALAAQKHIHEAQKGALGSPVLTAKDDMGHVVTIRPENLSYALFIDVDLQPDQRSAVAPHKGNGVDKPSIIM